MPKQKKCVKCGKVIKKGSFIFEWENGYHCPKCNIERERKEGKTRKKTADLRKCIACGKIIVITLPEDPNERVNNHCDECKENASIMAVRKVFGGSYLKVDNYCNKDNHADYESNTGVAYRYVRTNKVYCLEDCDLHRGRGEPKKCSKWECLHYTGKRPKPLKVITFFPIED